MKQSLLLFLSIALVAFSSCKKDEDILNVPTEVQMVRNLDATSADTFTLFNFATNSIVPVAEMETSAWDIGFKSTTIIVNGGAIRTGDAAATMYTGIFDEITEVPEDAVFKQDESETDLAIPTGSGNGWYTYDMAIHGVIPTAGKFILVRTAANKYVKMEILSYYKDMPTDIGYQNPNRAFYHFRFVHQADGTTKF